MSRFSFTTSDRIKFEQTLAGIRLREAVSYNGGMGLPIHFCKYCERPLQGHDLKDHLKRLERLETNGYLEDGDEQKPCIQCYRDFWSDDEDDSAKYDELWSDHPLNQLTSSTGNRRQIRSRSDWVLIRLDSGQSAPESRTHSRTKKPWRREQQFVEWDKNTIDTDEPDHYSDPEDCMSREDRHYDLYWQEIAEEGEREEIVQEQARKKAHEFLEDTDLPYVNIADYPNPYNSPNVADVLDNALWDGHHRPGCTCYDCEIRQYECNDDDYSDHEQWHDDALDDDLINGCGCADCVNLPEELYY